MTKEPSTQSKCRLYLITPPVIDDINQFADHVKNAFQGGDVACLQVRLKDGTAQTKDAEILRVAEKLLPIAKDAGVAMLLNDDPELAKRVGADGVHVGQDDADCRKAREILGDEASIGVTCHSSIDLAFKAGEDGADYVAFGAFFPTATKQAPTRAPKEILTQWQMATILPSVAIGGITPDNGAELVTAGADFLAVSAAIWQNADGPGAAVAAFNTMIAAASGDAG